MNASRVRARRGLLVLAAAGALATAGCAAGQHAATAIENPTIQGVNRSIGEMKLQNLSIAPPSKSTAYQAGAAVQVNVVLVNTNSTRTDTLTSVTTSAAKGWSAYPTYAAAQQAELIDGVGSVKHTVAIGAGQAASFGFKTATGGMLLIGLTHKLYAANSIRVTFTFAHAGTRTFIVPVQNSATPPPGQTIPAPSGSAGEGA